MPEKIDMNLEKKFNEFIGVVDGLLSGLLNGSVTPEVGKVACSAADLLLRAIEMRYKFKDIGAEDL